MASYLLERTKSLPIDKLVEKKKGERMLERVRAALPKAVSYTHLDVYKRQT